MRVFALAMIVVLAGACEDEKDSPEKAQRKAECQKLEDHIFRITPRPGASGPETDPGRIRELIAKVPIEDIEQCAAVEEPTVLPCMLAARDVPALRACIPVKKD